jgi:hypothetical protein
MKIEFNCRPLILLALTLASYCFSVGTSSSCAFGQFPSALSVQLGIPKTFDCDIGEGEALFFNLRVWALHIYLISNLTVLSTTALFSGKGYSSKCCDEFR